MDNRKGRTDAEEAVDHKVRGIANQVKGNVKDAWGAVTGDRSTQIDGAKDRIKGRVQEAYGDLKEKESKIESDLDDLERTDRY